MARAKRTTHRVDEFDILSNVNGKYVDKESRDSLFTFASIFNELLDKKGIDQGKIASDLGISTGAISAYRRGEQEPKLVNLISIAKYLGVDCHYLMTGVNSKQAKAADFTGLSSKALTRLHDLSKEKSNVNHNAVAALNMLLEDTEHGNQVLSDIYEYIAERYNAIGFSQLGSDEASHIGNHVALFENGKEIVDIPLGRIKAVFQTLIMENLQSLHGKYQSDGNGNLIRK